MSHTPGPWKQYANEIVGAEGTPEAWVVAKLTFGAKSSAPDFDYFNSEHREYREVTDANARLIAAAPEMLEALKEAEALYSRYGLLAQESACGPWINKVRFAIAKAEGK